MPSRMPRVLFSLKATTIPGESFLGEEGMVSGGVFDHGTHEEDGPVTWEALASPRHTPVMRRAGDPSPTHGTWRTHVSSAQEAQNKRPHRGRPLARGTGAVAEGGRASEGCIRALTSGNGGNARTRPSKGSPCRCDLQKGTMANALTLETMSPELQEVVGCRHEPHQRRSRMVEIS
jgi:hypothetical protein